METPSAGSCPTIGGLPALGLGTYRNDEPDQCATSVQTALEVGYRHVDTAEAYGNEAAVGRGLANAAVDRDDVFVATKVWHTNLEVGDVQAAARASRDRLGIETIDLLYVHWPAHTYDPAATLPAFAELADEGVIEHIGVSNFDPDQLATAVETVDAPILANQIELHPLLPQEKLRDACDRFDVAPVAYAPIARGEVFENPTIQDVADEQDATPAQVSLAWCREHGTVAIPKAMGRDHIAENWASLGLELPETAMERLDAIEERKRVVDPSFGPWNE